MRAWLWLLEVERMEIRFRCYVGQLWITLHYPLLETK